MAYPYGEPLENYDELEGRDSVDLLARIIYAEASTESKEGKRGVAFVIQNRKELVRNKAPHHKEFGKKATFESVILHPGQFNGAESDQMLKPVLKSKAWKDSLDIAQNLSDQDNPIGTCLWFNGVKVFQKKYNV
ncbi:hypothetical protein HPY31_19500 [Brevibacillus sp. HB1.3]|uniref:cell wall hydrolase n=1 Tax=Brevibacillus sp. HB1.3 TaxID=2738842 RepID=UPI0015563AC3|nr:cell wall hydrolase [Brevibacillus sp. HB1.3]NQF16087.1 hypothetical protein [Brevibacillus sp. HB1.3]